MEPQLPPDPLESLPTEPPLPPTQPLPVIRPVRRATRRWVWWLVLVVVVAGYIYRRELRDGPVGRYFGIQPVLQKSVAELYTCPMHPQYTSPKPGECPICNMTLIKVATPSSANSGPAGERKILYWQDPMNPSNRSDKPGKAPDGMDLVPVYAQDGTSPEMPPGTVKINPAKQQLIGVTYDEVTSSALGHTIRAVGRVAYDETKITHVHTKIDGWIEQIYVDFTGKLITKGQPLVSLYSPDLVSTQQEYLLALKARKHLGDSPYPEIAASTNALVEASRKRLQLWDIPEADIKQIEARGEPLKSLMIYAPNDGFILTKNAFEQQKVTPEMELYTLADLSRIWVLADIYEYEIPSIKLGQSATVTFSAFPGETFRGKVNYIYPQLDNLTRTLKVRIEFQNPHFKLKPDMYANVELEVGYGTQLSIPEEAVLDSGSEQTVFVALDGGYFEPRSVRLGTNVAGRYIVLSGLKVGERIVTSGNFLIDSESRLKSALQGMAGSGHSGHGKAEPSDGKPNQKTGSTSPDHSQY
ncbi:MAG: efflux RND transporter periplasmic adaptor subunit [Acidobacteria bacterium]|nr:efflux RND transporter periplasmic adaptor subunit [Acidobacteriota bacterium]